MKLQIKPYLKYALKDNVLYLFLIMFLTIFTAAFVIFAPTLFADNNKKLAQLQEDIKDLKLKKVILDSSVGENPLETEESVKIMSKLIPETEDYFSIIAALEELSSKTGFVVTSYEVDLQNSKDNKLSLNVTGVGDEQSFIDFLRQYNFQGERLITIEDISLGTSEIGSFGLILNFYAQKASSIKDSSLDYQAAIQTVKALRNKVNFNLQTYQEQPVEENYEKKTNPF